MTGTPEGPPEPRWPLWERRTVEWEAEDQDDAACPCVWLWILWDDVTLFGTVAVRYGVCVDCRQGWVRMAQE